MDEEFRGKTGFEVEACENEKGYLVYKLWKDGLMIGEHKCKSFWKSIEYLNEELDLGCVQMIAFKKDQIKRLKEEIKKIKRLK